VPESNIERPKKSKWERDQEEMLRITRELLEHHPLKDHPLLKRHVRLDLESAFHLALRVAAAERGVPMSKLVKLIVEEWLLRNAKGVVVRRPKRTKRAKQPV
jgi:hypothetical protein